MFRSIIFNNPAKWTERCVGTIGRYRLAQIMTIIFGAILAAMFLLLCSPEYGWKDRAPVVLFIILAVVEFPLMYLRALRYLYRMNLQASQQR